MTRLQAARLKLRLSQTALAAAAERLSGSDISRFENLYARPYPAQAARLAAVLGLGVNELLEPVVASEAATAVEARSARCAG